MKANSISYNVISLKSFNSYTTVKVVSHFQLDQLKDNNITYGFYQSKFGESLIAMVEGKVCFLAFVNKYTRQSSLNELKRKWHKNNFTQDDKLAMSYTNSIFDNKNYTCGIVTYGTEFQLKVWQELLKIPSGTAINYSTLAKNIGNKNATRAVGTACSKNDIAYLIPCHRVVNKNTKVKNYRWGLEVKERILEWEKGEQLGQ